MPHTLSYAVIVGLNILVALGVYTWVPAYGDLLVVEDSLVESLTAAVFLASLLLSLAMFVRGGRTNRAFVLIAALGLVGFLDEISYGARIFGVPMPRVRGGRIDGLHDVVAVGFRVLQKYRAFAYFAAAVAGSSLMLFALKLRKSAWAARVWRPPYVFLVFFALQVSLALLLDLNIARFSTARAVEEVSELNAAIALVFFSLALWSRGDGSRRPAPPMR